MLTEELMKLGPRESAEIAAGFALSFGLISAAEANQFIEQTYHSWAQGEEARAEWGLPADCVPITFAQSAASLHACCPPEIIVSACQPSSSTCALPAYAGCAMFGGSPMVAPTPSVVYDAQQWCSMWGSGGASVAASSAMPTANYSQSDYQAMTGGRDVAFTPPTV
jgi:hypothetical protein